jgi:hypothetical protein
MVFLEDERWLSLMAVPPSSGRGFFVFGRRIV